MLSVNDFLFYFLSCVALLGGLGVLFVRNPIYSALSLVISMIGIAGIFVTLNAFFVAGVQLIVYAGAVLVLFVMVLMLFDLKHELKTFSKGLVSGAVKIFAMSMILGLIAGASWISSEVLTSPESLDVVGTNEAMKNLSQLLFTKYVFGFELIGALLTIVAVGVVTLSRISGGTHADN